MKKYTVHARLLFMTANWFISHTVIEVPRSIAPGSREHHTVRTPSASFGICSRVVASSRDETGTCLGITNSIFKEPWLLRSLTRRDSTQLLNPVNLYVSTKKTQVPLPAELDNAAQVTPCQHITMHKAWVI